jgi:di/tricarboxylate transporter
LTLLNGGMARPFGQAPFGLFEFSKLGILYAIVGILYLLTIGRKLLQEGETLSSILNAYERREFLIKAAIGRESELIGKM